MTPRHPSVPNLIALTVQKYMRSGAKLKATTIQCDRLPTIIDISALKARGGRKLMNSIFRRRFAGNMALVLICALLSAGMAPEAGIKVVTSGAFTAAYQEL